MRGASFIWTFAMTTYEYDAQHERELIDAIVHAIVETSKIDDTIVLRTGEMASALTTALACTLAISPAVTRSPTTLRRRLMR
jgi:hypothetical protein